MPITVGFGLSNDKACERHFAVNGVNALDYRNGFGTVSYGKVCSCAPAFNFLSVTLVVPPQNVEVENAVKFVFSSMGDRIYRIPITVKCGMVEYTTDPLSCRI